MTGRIGWRGSVDVWAFRLLWISVFSMAFSLPAGRAFLFLSMLLLLYRFVVRRQRIAFPLVAWCWLGFVVVAVLASVFGVNPALSYRKLNKLIWFMGIPVAATLVRSPAQVANVLRAYVYGACVLSLKILVLRQGIAWREGCKAVAAGRARDLLWRIIDLGSMTHGQILMLAVVGLAGVLAVALQRRRWTADGVGDVSREPFGRVALVMLVTALLVNFKRGSWVVTGAVLALFLWMTGRRRQVLVLIAACVALVFLPPVHTRILELKREFNPANGGRIVMWTKIAPALIYEHPFGIGYRALDEKLMQSTARKLHVRVEKKRNHLHSNPIQILVVTGWPGLFVYLLWMGTGLFYGIHRIRFSTPRGESRTLFITLTLMLLGLLLNGLVEYNFGDAELVLVYGILLGCLSAGMGTQTGVREKGAIEEEAE